MVIVMYRTTGHNAEETEAAAATEQDHVSPSHANEGTFSRKTLHMFSMD